jgi:hypothetical protein
MRRARTYRIAVPGIGRLESPDPRGLADASDREVLGALYTPAGFIDPVAFQVLADRGLCYRGDRVADIERRIAARERQREAADGGN